MAARPRADSGDKDGPRRRRRPRSRLVLGLGVPAAVALAAFALVVYVDVTLTFESRRGVAPSRVYSDGMRLEAGAPFDVEQLATWLRRADYVATDADPSRPGEYRRRGGAFDVHLRSFDGGDRPLPARRVRITFADGRVAAIRAGEGRWIGRVDLEPVVLSLAFGSQQQERRFIRLADVPEGLVRAVLAAEDARFYSHPGFDPLAIVRAGLANLRSRRIVQGGSTITQQTVKNLYLGRERTWWRKIREAVLAVVLDVRYSKDRILETYLNEVYLGQRGSVAICGVQAAARHYFGRDVADLSPGEWATLAGLIRNPGGYNPFASPERAIERRTQVLAAMEEQGWIEAAAADAARREPLRLAKGGAGFSRDPYAVDLVHDDLVALGSEGAMAEGGLEVFTSIDPTVQEAAERALRDGLRRLEHDVPEIRRRRHRNVLQGAVVAIDPRAGSILAVVGGRDYRASQFNRAIRAKRQPGSCFKPFVYLAALEAGRRGDDGGLTAASLLDDSPIEIVSGGKVWRPANYDGAFRGPVTVRAALEESRNVPAIRAAQGTGIEAVIAAARSCGITAALEPLPSLALGAQDVTPLELAAAFATLANGGVRVTPRAVRRVRHADGRCTEPQPSRPERAVSAPAAFVLNDMLRGVITRGTASSASVRGFTGDAAGKTGTTDDTRDAWFVGYDPDLLVLVWVGYDDNTRTGLTGASGALPIWVDVMNACRHRWGRTAFRPPAGIVRASIDPESGGLATPGCPAAIEEVFIEGTEPTEPCAVHQGGFFRWLRRLFGGRAA